MELTLPSGFCYTRKSSTSLETLAGKLGIWALGTSAQKFSTGQNHTSALALAKKYVSNNTVASENLCESTVRKKHRKGTL